MSESFKPGGRGGRTVRGMSETIERAERYIWETARVVDQRRFEYLFKDGFAEPVRDAVLSYRTADGGFGYALEPDGRGPVSQPPHVYLALQLLEEAGGVGEELAREVADHLQGMTLDDGGVPLALPSLEAYPHAPWWSTAPEGSLIATARCVAVLLRTGIDHPWIDRASEFCWTAVDSMQETNPYSAEAAVVFLDAAPDRARAEAAAERIGRLVREQGLVGGEFGGQPGEVHSATDFAPRPDSLAGRWFSDAEMDAALDALQAEQQDNGGWRVKWIDGPTPATAGEWAEVTINALLTLRAYGRL
jgi:hypothetical protein